MADYLPSRESELVTWSGVFDQKITAAPGDFGLDAAQAAAYNVLHSAWISAYNAANDNGTRTPASIQTKNTAKEALIRGPGGIRELVKILQAYPGMTNTLRAEISVTIPDDEPSPVPRPTHAPEIDLDAPIMRRVRITLHNEKVFGRRGKPDGVSGALVFTYVGVSPPSPTDTGLWQLAANITKPTTEIQFPSSVPTGSTVWITAYWYNPKGESGPSAPAVYTILPGTLAEAA